MMKMQGASLVSWVVAFALGFSGGCIGATATANAAPVARSAGGALVRLICRVSQFGARGDGVSSDTTSIQGAIDACAMSNGGGVVVFDQKTYLTGTLQLKSNVDIKLPKGATLLGSLNSYDYSSIPKEAGVQNKNPKALLYSFNSENITIYGGGVIDGNGAANPFWNGSQAEDLWANRPLLILLSKMKNVTLKGVTLQNSASWTVVINQDDGVIIDQIVLNAAPNINGVNLDGIDLVDSRNIEIKNSQIASQDDAIVLKSIFKNKAKGAGVSNVHVHDVEVSSLGANGLKIGTYVVGSVSHIVFENLSIKKVMYGAMEVESVDGGSVADVTFNNIKVGSATSLLYVMLASRAAELPGSIDGITFQNISASNISNPWAGVAPDWAHASTNDLNAGWGNAISGAMINGVVYAPTNIVLNNVRLNTLGGATSIPRAPKEYPYSVKGSGYYPDVFRWQALPAYGFYIRHVKNISLTDVRIVNSSPDVRPAFVIDKDVAVSASGQVTGVTH